MSKLEFENNYYLFVKLDELYCASYRLRLIYINSLM